MLVQCFYFGGRWKALILFIQVFLGRYPEKPLKTPEITGLRSLPDQPSRPGPRGFLHCGELQRSVCGTWWRPHRKVQKGRGCVRPCQLFHSPKTLLMSSRGEEGACEYPVITPGNKNPRAKVPAGTMFSASHTAQELWANQPYPGASRDRSERPRAGGLSQTLGSRFS